MVQRAIGQPRLASAARALAAGVGRFDPDVDQCVEDAAALGDRHAAAVTRKLHREATLGVGLVCGEQARRGAGADMRARGQRGDDRRQIQRRIACVVAARRASPCRATWVWPMTTRVSTRTAARSRSGTRWAGAARDWSQPRSTSCTALRARYALRTMCIRVGQGIAIVVERV
jgi:hypothetical protein